jgi:hypothetical protein
VLYVTLIRTNSVRKRSTGGSPGDQAFPTDAAAVREARFILLKGYEGDDAK